MTLRDVAAGILGSALIWFSLITTLTGLAGLQ